MNDVFNKQLENITKEKKRLCDDNAILARKCAKLALEAECNREALKKNVENAKMADHAELLAARLEEQLDVNEKLRVRVINATLDIEEIQKTIENDMKYLAQIKPALLMHVEAFVKLLDEYKKNETNAEKETRLMDMLIDKRKVFIGRIEQISDKLADNLKSYHNLNTGIVHYLNKGLAITENARA